MEMRFTFSCDIVANFKLIRLTAPACVEQVFFVQGLFCGFSALFLDAGDTAGDSHQIFLPAVYKVEIGQKRRILVVDAGAEPAAIHAAENLVYRFGIAVALLVELA